MIQGNQRRLSELRLEVWAQGVGCRHELYEHLIEIVKRQSDLSSCPDDEGVPYLGAGDAGIPVSHLFCL